MADSLREQLLKCGLAKEPPQRKPRLRRGGKPDARTSGKDGKGSGACAQGEIDLARAYAMRAREANEARRRAQHEAEEKARRRQQLNRRLDQLLNGHTLNKPDAELMRHFPYGDKIRRVYVDAEQMRAVNRGELGVIQYRGRYLLVERRRVEAIAAFAPDHVALWVDPHAASADDGVPDDLRW